MSTTYDILNTIVTDLENKLKKEPERFVANYNSLMWVVKRFERDGKLCEEVPIDTGISPSRRGLLKKAKDENKEEKEDRVVIDKRITLSYLKWQDSDNNRTCRTISISTMVNGHEEKIDLNLTFIDMFRPLTRRLFRLFRNAERVQKERNITRIDKEFSRINSNRIDDILFGGTKSEQKD